MTLTARERRILKLAKAWRDGEWEPGKQDILMLFIQRQACADAILKLFPKAALKLK